MLNLFNETSMYGSSSLMLNIVSILSIVLGVYVIISKNPVISILFLIGLFFSVSMYLIIIGLHFIGLSYLLVYIGAVSIFFIFIVMLINIRISELLTDNKNSLPLAFITIFIFNYFLSDILPFNAFMYDVKSIPILTTINNSFSNILSGHINNISNDVYLDVLSYFYNQDLVAVTSKSWDSILVSSSHVSSIGSVLYTNFYILLIVISLILLLAMIGAIVITMGKKVN